MTALPTGPRGRLLAVGLAILALVILWLGLVSPALAWYADRADTLDQQRAVAARMAALADSLPDLQRLAAETAGAAEPLAVLEGATDAVAGATLQELVQDMANQSRASLASVETLPAEQRGAYRRIALRVSVSADWPVLVQFLAAVEQATPRMLIDDLQLRGQSARLRLVGTAAAGPPPVEASLTIIAFRAGSGPPTQ